MKFLKVIGLQTYPFIPALNQNTATRENLHENVIFNDDALEFLHVL